MASARSKGSLEDWTVMAGRHDSSGWAKREEETKRRDAEMLERRKGFWSRRGERFRACWRGKTPPPFEAQGNRRPPAPSALARAATSGVLLFRVYANGNYWTAAGGQDHAVSDFDEGQRRRQGGGFGDARRRGESTGATAAATGYAVQPEEDYLRYRAIRGPRRDAEGTLARCARALAGSGYDCQRHSCF